LPPQLPCGRRFSDRLYAAAAAQKVAPSIMNGSLCSPFLSRGSSLTHPSDLA
jgi:hypothetical protein